MRPLRVVIVGGGVCGLGVAWKLAQAGADVTVFERDESPRGATWLSAGMLAPHVELRPREEWFLPLGRENMRRWRRFAAEVEADSGISVDYRDEGTLYVALDRDATEQLRFLHRHQQDIGVPVDWLSGYEARQREPHLARAVTAALYSPDDHQVDPRALGDALLRACGNRGAKLRTASPVERIAVSNGRAVGVVAEREEVAADAVVLAAGAWSGLVEGLPQAAVPPVRPVKGQMLAVQQPHPPLLTHCVWASTVSHFAYLAPKSNGRLLVGATVEEQGFDTQVTAGGMLDLLRPAWETLPGIYDLPVVETWAGLRPGSRDNAPILGKTPLSGLFLATGHYRNGILYAPVTAEDVAHVVLTGETPDTIAAFGIERFLT
jgi:glycine oxidase